ncbi:UNVERIFIED_CONTAM: atzF, partial [Trichonephila clavipes]
MPARPRLAVPANPEFFGDSQNQAVYRAALDKLQGLGADLVEIDFAPFQQLAEQLYYGSWVAERTVAVEGVNPEHINPQLAEQLYYGSWVAERTVAVEGVNPEHINPVVRGIVANGHKYSACDAYKAEYIRAELSRVINDALASFDALVVPTSPTLRTLAEMEAEPVLYNSQFGTYTNFTNLADLSALAVPAGLRADGLPAGITLIAPAWHDQALAAFGQRWQQALDLPMGATGKPLPAQNASDKPAPGSIRVAVVGAHLTGMPLNFQLTTRDAVL